MISKASRNKTTVVSSYPEKVKEIENVWITVSDGCRLAARIWMPRNAEKNPVPAILEYLPYRKRDGTAIRDQLTYPYYAGHGYAGVRVDMRGNGESDGLMFDEYLKQEQDDAVEVVDWIAAQPWCDGNVGMMGISWGGFNSLQVAARRPPALKAIITLCSTDDRYGDDIHYKGGAMLMENLGWASTMLAFSSRPPDPVLVGERWKDMWMERLNNLPLLIENWLRHPHRDEYWKQGSVCEAFEDIEAAVYAIGGWGDAYSNAVPRLLVGLNCPVRGLIGPWIHQYPHFAKPEPAVGFLQDSLQWWDFWLKGKDNGVMNKPLYQAYMMDSVLPQPFYESRCGQWVTEQRWPSSNVQYENLVLNRYGLTESPANSVALTLCSPQNTGVACGEYCAMWQGPESPTDQRQDDAGSLVFDSEPLASPKEVFGAPVVELDIDVDRPQANIVCRLCDVWPGGESTRITYGVLNLCHHSSHEHPQSLEPGRKYHVRIQLDDIAYRIAPGNRIRLALSTAYWPLIWPSPEHVTATVYCGSSILQLPVRKAITDDVPILHAPVTAPPLHIETLRPPRNERTVEYDLVSGETVVHIKDDFGEYKNLEHGLTTGQSAYECYRIHAYNPASCRASTHWTETLCRNQWSIRTETTTKLRSDKSNFYVNAQIDAFEGEQRIYERHWHRRLKRNQL